MSHPPRAKSWPWLASMACGLTIGMGSLAAAQDQPPMQTPLHDRIDAAIEAGLSGAVAPQASDAEFLRRVSLDLTGCIPSASEARAFLDDMSPDKRARLIDRLLASPAYPRQMQVVFDVMLMQRRPDKHVPSPEWNEYLRTSFAENKPYDQLAREILSADGVSPDMRPAAKFYLDREAEPNLLTRDVGRLFLGRDMQCAQCHDHPLIPGYKQDHYYGLYSFLSRSFVFTDPKQKKSFLAEKGDGDVTFKSVFDPMKVTKTTGPHLIDAPLVAEPKFDKGQEYLVAPAKDVRPIPKFSRRAQLESAMAKGNSPDFNRNIVNRLWAMMMGRGLVHPVDLHHSENPPSHPALLEMLSQDFVAMKFDIPALLRELALTKTYQRSSSVPDGMTPEQAAPQRFAVAALKPLSPEQLAWSLMEAAGVTEAPRAAEKSRIEGDPRLVDILNADDKRRRMKPELIEKAVYNGLKGNVAAFVGLYGGAPGDTEGDFQPTVHQALFVANGSVLKSWLAPNGVNLTGRVAAMPDLNAAADELYLSVFSRRPDDGERAEAIEYMIRGSGNRAADWQEIAWALLSSAEFRFNH